MILPSRSFRASWFDQFGIDFFLQIFDWFGSRLGRGDHIVRILSQMRSSFRYFLLYEMQNPWGDINFKCRLSAPLSLSEIHSQLHGFLLDIQCHDDLWQKWDKSVIVNQFETCHHCVRFFGSPKSFSGAPLRRIASSRGVWAPYYPSAL